MKTMLKASFLALGLSISAFAADPTPVSSKGEVTLPPYAGASTCEISNSSSTNVAFCATGPVLVLQVIGSSVASTDYLTFRDTGSALNSSASNILHYTQGSTPVGNLIFPRFSKGLAVGASVAPVGTSGFWTIIYTKDLK